MGAVKFGKEALIAEPGSSSRRPPIKQSERVRRPIELLFTYCTHALLSNSPSRHADIGCMSSRLTKRQVHKEWSIL
jgi:hypothetical protein